MNDEIKPEIINSLKEMREVTALCFRIIEAYSLVDVLELRLKRLKIKDGFGIRCQELISKLQRN